jgi:hypothetical protein
METATTIGYGRSRVIARRFIMAECPHGGASRVSTNTSASEIDKARHKRSSAVVRQKRQDSDSWTRLCTSYTRLLCREITKKEYVPPRAIAWATPSIGNGS